LCCVWHRGRPYQPLQVLRVPPQASCCTASQTICSGSKVIRFQLVHSYLSADKLPELPLAVAQHKQQIPHSTCDNSAGWPREDDIDQPHERPHASRVIGLEEEETFQRHPADPAWTAKNQGKVVTGGSGSAQVDPAWSRSAVWGWQPGVGDTMAAQTTDSEDTEQLHCIASGMKPKYANN